MNVRKSAHYTVLVILGLFAFSTLILAGCAAAQVTDVAVAAASTATPTSPPTSTPMPSPAPMSPLVERWATVKN